MATHQLADPSMKIPEMLQKAINPIIKRPSLGQNGQGNGRILSFIKLLKKSFDSCFFFALDANGVFLLEILLKGYFACIPLSR